MLQPYLVDSLGREPSEWAPSTITLLIEFPNEYSTKVHCRTMMDTPLGNILDLRKTERGPHPHLLYNGRRLSHWSTPRSLGLSNDVVVPVLQLFYGKIGAGGHIKCPQTQRVLMDTGLVALMAHDVQVSLADRQIQI